MGKERLEKILIIKSGRDSFERYYADRIRELGYSVIFGEDLYNPFDTDRKRKIRALKASLSKLKAEGAFEGYEKVIVFDFSSAIPYIKKVLNKQTKLYSYLWNILGTRKDVVCSKINKLFCKVYSFDPAEAKRYKLKYNPQFFFNQLGKPCENSGHIFFAGLNKDRANAVLSLAKFCDKNGVKHDFTIVGDEISAENFAPVKVKSQAFDYQEILQKVGSEKCVAVLDMVRAGQVGLTVRAMEALFFDKKLITNNKSITGAKFYDAQNVFILGVDDLGRLKEFLDAPAKPYGESAKEYYEFKSFIERFN